MGRPKGVKNLPKDEESTNGVTRLELLMGVAASQDSREYFMKKYPSLHKMLFKETDPRPWAFEPRKRGKNKKEKAIKEPKARKRSEDKAALVAHLKASTKKSISNEELLESASKYKSLGEWIKGDQGKYRTAFRREIHRDIASKLGWVVRPRKKKD